MSMEKEFLFNDFFGGDKVFLSQKKKVIAL